MAPRKPCPFARKEQRMLRRAHIAAKRMEAGRSQPGMLFHLVSASEVGHRCCALSGS